MKLLVMALVLAASGSVFADVNCGGRNPCHPDQVPFSGVYAPGWGPGTLNYEANSYKGAPCGGRQGPPCGQQPVAYTGCKEGRKAVVTVPTGTYNGRTEVMGTEVFVCHDNEWIME